MPASAASNRPEDLIGRLSSAESGAKLKALREVKNQIIGNRTKKISYVKLGAVPRIVDILGASDDDAALLIQSAAALGSFACGVDAGVRAVLDSGAYPHLVRLLSNPDPKVVDAGARSLKMIFQSKLAPKYDLLKEKNMEFFLLLLNSENENVTELAASIITHSCETSTEQKALCDAMVLPRLICLLEGSLGQRDASLDSLATILKNNSEAVSKFVSLNNGRALRAVIELTKDRYPRTRLLACVCLIAIGIASPRHMQELEVKTKLIGILIELLEEPGRTGDEAPFTLAQLIANKEDLQKLAFDVNAVERLCNFLQKAPLTPPAKRFEAILLALAELCSKLESCRSKFLSLQALNIVLTALKHDCAEVRIAACNCIKSISRSVKNLSAGRFTSETIVAPLVQLLHDPVTSVQVAALCAISNIVVDFTNHKLVFIQNGAVKQLVQLSKSMDSKLRLNAVWALRNLAFLADRIRKDCILQELTISTLASLIYDPEPPVQEQSLALVCNLVDGGVDSIEHVFLEDSAIINAVAKQVWRATTTEVCIQGMHVFSNIATGNELHKEAVMHHLLPQAGGFTQSVIIRFLQGTESQLRTAAVWCIINLTYPESPNVLDRVARLRQAGIISQIKNMINDPCLDVKYRVRTALEQCAFGNCSM
ncbi:armadillo repeat-containing protein 8-like protein isoform X1 [Cinnamomum micranthum f. kanehirae]|uniref:Armadillo repeat-containing protein 8-like protein isoform X1 n=1 Tax=Cinnamomum micranthum f. kanehirae TaxID=337451 RepID=A0A443NGW9_9MAGN|nr:armadillo repeat-containing protein 8-like protein isoform X1 [Cinnamomum micranthum f. kanehirae]